MSTLSRQCLVLLTSRCFSFISIKEISQYFTLIFLDKLASQLRGKKIIDIIRGKL